MNSIIFKYCNGKHDLTLPRLAIALAMSADAVVRRRATEEDLASGFEKRLEPVLAALGVTLHRNTGRPGAGQQSVLRGPTDAACGSLVIQYEKPRSLESKQGIRRSFARVRNAILSQSAASGASDTSGASAASGACGVGFDGVRIFFVRHGGRVKKAAGDSGFIMSGPYDFATDGAAAFLMHLRGLSRRALTAHNLSASFGPRGGLAKTVVSALAEAFTRGINPRVKILFDRWKHLLQIGYGGHADKHRARGALALSMLYGCGSDRDPHGVLFCVHTYFALLAKLVATELSSITEVPYRSSTASKLSRDNEDRLRQRLAGMERGSIHSRSTVTETPEFDPFGWYLDAWSPRIGEAVRGVAGELSGFEPATGALEPSSTGDLLKGLYHDLVPKEIRRRLGEYYTPDWLAELLLDEVGYGGDPDDRLLDPACGSGTFLVLAIRRAIETGRRGNLSPAEITERIQANIRGFDRNPLAVIAARTNYLFALSGLAHVTRHTEIPVYLADPIVTPAPAASSPSGGFTHVSPGHAFDFVVGNPPWIRWGSVPVEYREATRKLWKEYGLFSLRGHAARLGGGEKDLSMLFTYAAADRHLKHGGKLGFLITQEVFKSKGAGEGFRRFRIGRDGAALRVFRAHDLVQVRPFEGAANKTAAIILRKGQPTRYPVPYTVWTRRDGTGRIPAESTYEDALRLTQRRRMTARPMGKPNGPWQTLPADRKGLLEIAGESAYRARAGGYFVPYGVFWLDIVRVLPDGNLTVRNMPGSGKWDIEQVEETIEPDLVFPAVRGPDIERWNTEPGIHALVTQDPGLRAGYPEEVMKHRWPATYRYLKRFERELLNRAAYRKYYAQSGGPFYSQYNIANYSFTRYKVVWKRMSNDITAAVISKHGTPFGEKTVVSTDTTSHFSTGNADEAHYLCAIVNSAPVRDFIRSFSSAGRGFGAPSVMRHVRIQPFDSGSSLHRELAEISKACHRLRSSGKDAEDYERDNSKLVTKLFGR